MASKHKFYPEDVRYLQGGSAASIAGALDDNNTIKQEPPALNGEIVDAPSDNETHTTI